MLVLRIFLGACAQDDGKSSNFVVESSGHEPFVADENEKRQ